MKSLNNNRTTKQIKEERGKSDGEILKTELEVSKRQKLEGIYMPKNSEFWDLLRYKRMKEKAVVSGRVWKYSTQLLKERRGVNEIWLKSPVSL